MKRLFNEYEAQNDVANKLDEEIATVITPIINRYLLDEYSNNDIELVITRLVSMILSEKRIVAAALKKRTSNQKESEIMKRSFIRYIMDNESIDNYPVLYIPIGIPGSGKSTFIEGMRKMYEETFGPAFPLFVVSPDEIRKDEFGDINDHVHNNEVWEIAHTKVYDLLCDLKYDVVLDATNVDEKLREMFIKRLYDRMWNDEEISLEQFKVVYILFLTSNIDVLYERIRKDLDNGKVRSDVPYSVLEKMLKRYNKSVLGESGINNMKLYPITEREDVVLAFPDFPTDLYSSK